tara:strand:- start:1569 stop:1790 length:222 start_codon:yes stop_codon:yes gene_type:complete
MQGQDMQRARDLPAPRTIAPSREDVLSNLSFFFGDPAVPEKLRDYSEHHAMTFHFPGKQRLRTNTDSRAISQP